jgi:hypothetical protein
MTQQRGCIIHIAEGSYDGTISWQMNPDAEVSSHFVVAYDGRITQMVDTDVTAWTQGEGNGKWLSIENEGYTPNDLTEAQMQANARILAKANQVYGVPLEIATCPTDWGLGHHSMGAECGYAWGHDQCPGPAIKAQKPTILAYAKGEDDVSAQDVWKYDVDPSGASYTASGALWTAYARTDYLANQFAPAVVSALNAIQAQLDGLTGLKSTPVDLPPAPDPEPEPTE